MNSRERVASAVAVGLLCLTLPFAVALAHLDRWDPVLLAMLLALIIGTEFVQITFKGVDIAGNFLALVLTMALIGPVAAAGLGLVSSVVWAVRVRPRWSMGLMSLAAYTTAPLVGGVAMRALADAMKLTTADLAFALPLLTGFLVAHVLSFGIVFAAAAFVDRAEMRDWLRSIVLPLLPSEAAMALLASVIVYAESHLGPAALAMLAALFFLYLYLLRQLVLSQERGELLERRTEQLASLQVGVLTTMLRTLSMRDRMTARHSAAVARYARALCQAAGCTEEEQDLVHTAGLLHDIGKFILPDHILLADKKLSEEDWQLIKMHPYQGAKVVREVEGYGPIADIIWAHHERIDGRGYPRGLSGEEIPKFSRMISIADTYDVMTSRDSYRDPVSSEAAIAELRRVSGAQLDGELVEIFIAMLESRGLAFRHADDADFEAELAFERRMRDHAAPRALPDEEPAVETADLPKAA